MTNSKIGKILSVATTVCVVLTGLLLIICCAHIYFTGGSTPYSRERVGDYLAWLVIPMALTLLISLCGVIYNAIVGEKVDKTTPRTNGELLESYYAKYNPKSFDKKTVALTREIRRKRNIIDLCASMISSFAFVFVLDYLFFIAKFSIENLNSDVMSALKVSLPICLLGVGVHLVRAYLSEKSAGEELELLKASIKEHGAPKKIEVKTKERKGPDSVLMVRIVLLCVAITFVVIGIFNGGMDDVIAKAVKICTECIGLG